MDLDALYQEVILDHYKKPRCHGCLKSPDAQATLHNPLCGDRVQLTVAIKDGRISEMGFSGHGCSISQASASMMSELCVGKTLDEIKKLAEDFRKMMRGELGIDSTNQAEEVQELVAGPKRRTAESLGDAVALEGVRRFSARVKCALLAWEALEKCVSKAEAQ